MLIIGHDRRLASLCVVSGRRSPNAMVPHHQALSSRRNRPWHGGACFQAAFCGKMRQGSPAKGNKVFGKSTSLSAAEVPAWGSAEQSAVTAAHVSRWPATRFRLCPEQSPSIGPRAIPIKTTCPLEPAYRQPAKTAPHRRQRPASAYDSRPCSSSDLRKHSLSSLKNGRIARYAAETHRISSFQYRAICFYSGAYGPKTEERCMP